MIEYDLYYDLQRQKQRMMREAELNRAMRQSEYNRNESLIQEHKRRTYEESSRIKRALQEQQDTIEAKLQRRKSIKNYIEK